MISPYLIEAMVEGGRRPAPYAWLIVHDHLDDDTDVGQCGPRNAPDEMLARLKAGEGRTFKLYDDDDILYYTGRILGEYDGFEPLADFGEGWAGCTGIRYPGSPDYGNGALL